VHAKGRDQLAATAAALAGLGGQPTIDEATRRVTVGVDGAVDGLRAAVAALAAAAAEIDDIALRQPTLDEVFLALTGQSPSADAAAA
jgi:ABC-2 type transport system ATP-binding protein